MKKPVIQWVGGKQCYQLMEDFRFITSVGIWTVPAGFLFDGASVPRIPFVYARYGNTAQEGALLHDYLYRTKKSSRKTADRAFLEVMEQFNNPSSPSKRKAMYLAVRSFGWAAY